MITIPDALRLVMKWNDWNQTELATELGMGKSHFSEVMSGKRRLPLDARIKAHKLGLSGDVLLQDDANGH